MCMSRLSTLSYIFVAHTAPNLPPQKFQKRLKTTVGPATSCNDAQLDAKCANSEMEESSKWLLPAPDSR